MAVIEYLSVVLALDHSNFDKKVQSAAESVSRIGKSLIAAEAGRAAASFSIDAIKLAASAETASIQFEVLLGSAERAKSAIADFRQIDRETPLGFADIQRAAKTMLAFGVEADDLGKRLRQLSAISMGNEERFQSLALAFGQTTAAGRLMGQEALQYINAGFSPLQQLSKSTGVSMRDLKVAMENGAISIDLVEKAFDQATEKGGLFYGMNERVSQTTEGGFAKLSSDVSEFKREVGDGLLPLVKELAGELRDLVAVGKNLKLPEFIGKGVQGWRAISKMGGAAIPFNLEAMLDPFGAIEKQKAAIFGDQEIASEQKKTEAIKEATREKGRQNDQLRDALQLEMNRSKLEKERAEREKQEKKTQEDLKRIEEERQRIREQQASEAFDIRKSLDPRLGVQEEVDRAAKLMRAGMLSMNDFQRFRTQQARDFAIGQVNRPQDTPLALRGSVEAYRLMMQREADREEERRILQEQASLLRNIDRSLDRAPTFKVFRR